MKTNDYVLDPVTLRMVPAPPRWWERPFKKRTKNGRTDIPTYEIERKITARDIERPEWLYPRWHQRLLKSITRAVASMVGMWKHIN